MVKNRSLVGVTVLFTALAVGVPSMEVLALQNGGHGPSQPAKPQKQEKKRDKKAEKRDDKRDDKHDRIVFDRDGHTRIIRDYGRGGGLPPGLAKRDALPPGLRRQLRERGTLPPGLQRHLVVVPGELGSRLPSVPTYYTRYFAGDDLVVVDTRTNTIAAIVRDVWR